VNIHGTFRDHSGNIQGTFSEHSAYLHGARRVRLKLETGKVRAGKLHLLTSRIPV
jgi:hypothetical protein